VRRAKQLRDQTGKPMLLPIRVNFPIDAPLNYDLRGYLQRIQQREWQTAADTAVILAEMLELMAMRDRSRPQPVITPAVSEELDAPPIVESLAQQESVQMPPLPVAEPELPGGQVDVASQFYVERGQIEARCYEAITTAGALIRIKAPRQMGKTSLMSRILRHAEQAGCLGVPLSFQVADSVVFGDLDRFLRWFAASVGRRLKLPNRLNDYWDEVFGSKDNCTAYFEEYLLPTLEKPLALCLDEVDMVFQHESIAADFFGLLRNWHEMGKSNDLWKQFRLVVVHSTEVYIPMHINQSPFNVGLPIELPEFTADQVQDLAGRHGLTWNTSQIGRLMGMVGGHPYLVRLALYHIARGDTTLEALLRQAPTEAGLYGDHLRRHLWNLEQHPELAAAVQQLVATEGPVRLPSVQAFQLHSMGLVDLQGNDVMFRSELYRAYFADRLRSQ
jgi:AAA-like domain